MDNQVVLLSSYRLMKRISCRLQQGNSKATPVAKGHPPIPNPPIAGSLKPASTQASTEHPEARVTFYIDFSLSCI